MDLRNEIYIRDLEHMTRVAGDIRTYVSATVAKCDEILDMFNNAAANQIFAGTAGTRFSETLMTWVKGVRDSLPEAEALSAALDEAVAIYIEAENRLRQSLE